MNTVVLIGATVFFFMTLETRIKRGKALKAIHELRRLCDEMMAEPREGDKKPELSYGPREVTIPLAK